MKIAIASDHAGFWAKERLRHEISTWGHEVEDLGTYSEESVDYPDYAEHVAQEVASGRAERGFLICGTGIGMSMAANKVDGVRAALVHDRFTAEMCRRHNDANVLCLGATVLPSDQILELAKLFLSVPFDGGRHERRVHKLDQIHRKEKTGL